MSWPIVAAFAALVTTLVSGRILADADTYWHLATGRWILSHGSIPVQDVFSHSMPDKAWTAHEWGADLLMTWVHQYAGWAGLQLLTAAAFAATMAYLTRFLLKRVEPVHAVALMVLAAAMMYTHLLARPHVLVWPATAVWMGVLVDSSEKEVAPPWWLLGLLVFWANFHASFTLGVALAGAVGMDALVQAPNTAARWTVVRRWGLFGIACCSAVLVNPQGYHAITYALEVMNMKVTLDLVNEWKSPDFHEPQMLMFWMIAVFGLALSGRLKLPWMRAVLILGLLYLSLKHQRYHDLLGIISPILLATPLAASVYGSGKPERGADGLDRWFHALALPARRVTVIASLLLMVAIGTAFATMRDVKPIDATTPAKALEAAQQAGVTGRVFNAYNFGGYLIFRGIPVYIDGRSDMYGDSLMQETFDATALKKSGSLEKTLDRYQISWTLLAPTTAAVQLLDKLPEWKRIYGDSVAVVHVRRDSLVIAAPSR